MKAELIVKNFGPIESVNLDLRNVNVFIGPQASGKSVLAKIYTICKSPLGFISEDAANNLNIEGFKKKLEEYNIGSFLRKETLIEFKSELHYFKFEKGEIIYDRKLLKKIEELEVLCNNPLENEEKIVDSIFDFSIKLFIFQAFALREILGYREYQNKKALKECLDATKYDTMKLKQITETLLEYEKSLSQNLALYIPSERNLIPIIKGASLNLQNNNVPIPKHILTFGAEYEKAAFAKKEIDLSFIKEGLFYKNEHGEDRIYFNSNQSIKLSEAASGIQTLLPLLLPILSRREFDSLKHNSFVIEEPELNLFPKAQFSLIKTLEKDRLDSLSLTEDIGTIHTYTTHSPYILSSFNNLLFAHKVMDKIWDKKIMSQTFSQNIKKDPFDYAKDKIKAIIPVYLKAENFSAYQIFNGKAKAILNRTTGLIEDNFIDQASDAMGDDFDKLMELMETELATA